MSTIQSSFLTTIDENRIEDSGKPSNRPRQRQVILIIALTSIFLATCDCLLHGPINASLFNTLYDYDATGILYRISNVGFLAGGLLMILCTRFIVQHRNTIVYGAFVIIMATILVRVLCVESNITLCFICIFLSTLMIPFSKVLFFFDVISTRNASVVVLSLAFGQVGKIILLSALNDASEGAQKIIFIGCGIVCLASVALFQRFCTKVRLKDNSELLMLSNSRISFFVGEIIFTTMLAALFSTTKIGGGFPHSAAGGVLEIVLYTSIVLLPWYNLTKRQERAATKFRDVFIFLTLGLLVLLGQSNDTWMFSNEALHQVSTFFESYALVVCWSVVTAFSWEPDKEAATMFGIAILAWFATSIIWSIISSVLGGPVSLLVGVILYLCTVAAGKIFPNVQVVEIEKPQRSEKDILKELAENHGLSEREEEIFMMLAQGRSRQSIAKTLFVSEGTVKTHASNIYRKFGVNSKDGLLAQVDQLKTL